MTDEELAAIDAAAAKGDPDGVVSYLDVQILVAEVQRWKACATELSHQYEGREPRPEEWFGS